MRSIAAPNKAVLTTPLAAGCSAYLSSNQVGQARLPNKEDDPARSRAFEPRPPWRTDFLPPQPPPGKARAGGNVPSEQSMIALFWLWHVAGTSESLAR